MKNALKFGVDIKVWHGWNCIKLKVPGQLGTQFVRFINKWVGKGNKALGGLEVDINKWGTL